jgi:hypothetical protein
VEQDPSLGFIHMTSIDLYFALLVIAAVTCYCFVHLLRALYSCMLAPTSVKMKAT